MKPVHILLLLLALVLASCAYTIPNGGQSVIADVADSLVPQSINGNLMAAAPQSSMSHAQARTQQSNGFWGGAK